MRFISYLFQGFVAHLPNCSGLLLLRADTRTFASELFQDPPRSASRLAWTLQLFNPRTQQPANFGQETRGVLVFAYGEAL